jgi:hypothetical protein
MRMLSLMLATFALLSSARATPAREVAAWAPRPPLSEGTTPGGQAAAGATVIQGAFGPPVTFSTRDQLRSYGFSYGPSSGQFGAIPAGDGSYTFYGAGGSSSACAGTPNVANGAFTFTGSLDSVSGSSCSRLFGAGDGPAGWVFDRDYAGGGQVVPFAAGGQSGWLMPFQGQLHWQNPATADHLCDGAPCIYSSLGLAVSTDDGETFKVSGQILQPSEPLSFFTANGGNPAIGYGSLVVADANGLHIDNPPADPSNAYFYLFYSDFLPGSPGACAKVNCLGVARAAYGDLVAAALSGDPDRVAMVFHKYDGASPNPWSQPATSDTPDESGRAGTYAPLWTDASAYQPEVIYDSSLGRYLAAYGFGGGVTVRVSSDLIHWSGPIAVPYSEPGRMLFQPTLLGETGDPTIGGPAPRVYFTSFPAATFPNWADTTFESVPLTLTTAAVPAIQGAFGSPTTFATRAQLQGYGFSYGPSDLQFGAISAGNGSYTFYGAAGTTSTCAGTPNAQNGAFTFTGTLDHITGSSCTRLFGPGDGPAGWIFNRDYAGAGQIARFASGGANGWLVLTYGEFHWQDPAAASGYQCQVQLPFCIYTAIGLAVSTDDAKTFKVVGQIFQPSQSLSTYYGGSRSLYTGDGSLLVADANGRHLDNPPADPSSAYFYLFFGDLLPGLPGDRPGVARAPYASVVAAALSGDPDKVATVFHKYDGASPDPWTQPATSDTPDESGTAGAYAPLWTDESGNGLSVIYDSSFNVYLAVYPQPLGVNHSGLEVRASSDLIHWSAPIAAYSEPDRSIYQPTILGETGEPTIGGPAPRVYFTSFASPPGFPHFDQSTFESLPLTLSAGTASGSP